MSPRAATHIVWLLLVLSFSTAHVNAVAGQNLTTARIHLADDGGMEVFRYDSSATATVWLVDVDSNTDSGRAEEVSIDLWSDSAPTPQSISLTETGTSSNTFTAEVDLSFATVGDRLTVAYLDPADSFGNPRRVSDVAYYAVSTFSGLVANDTTWTAAASPIVIIGDVTVPRDVTLTLEPGVEIRFLPLIDAMGAGEDSLRLELNVLGGLVAEGTEADSIIFTSDALRPDRGDWYGLFLGDSLATVSLAYNKIEYGIHGVFIESFFDTPADTVRVVHSRLRELEETAIHARYSRRHFILEDNLIENAGAGIRVEIGYNEASGVVARNTVRRTGGPGISLDRALWFSLADNVVEENDGVGLHAYRVDSLFVRGETLRRNRGGVYLNEVPDARIVANEIRSNRAWGVQLYRSEAKVDSNLVVDNATDEWAGGVYVYTDLRFPVEDSLLYNQITGNGGEGIHNDGRARTVARFNNLFDNLALEYRNTSTDWDEVDARLNWWGPETTLEISELGFNPKNLRRLHDVFDDPSAGLIDYSGWLLEEYVHQDSIRLNRPVAGQVWRAGTSEIIVWSPSPDPETLLDIVLVFPNGTSQTLAQEIANQHGSWVWVIPSDLRGGTTYQILLQDSKSGRVIDSSGDMVILPATTNRVVSVTSGWNLVGVPLGVQQSGFSDLFPSADGGSLLTFDGTFRNPDGSAMVPGTGYWLRTNTPDSVRFDGLETWTSALRLARGWNLVSGPNCDGRGSRLKDGASVLVPGSVFGFDGTYQQADVLESGSGYWVQAANDGTVWMECLSDDGSATVVEANGDVGSGGPADLGALEVQAEGFSIRRLQFGRSEPADLDVRKYALPPLPSPDLVDIRFKDDSFLHFMSSGSAQVVLTGDTREYKLRWDGEPGTALQLSAAGVDGMPLLYPGDEITWLGPPMLTAEIVTQNPPSSLPAEFSLVGPYPNPFRTFAEIRYALPEATEIDLRVYDVLGRLVNRQSRLQQAGTGTLRLEADGLTSGLYLFVVEAGPHRATGTLILTR